MRESYFFVKARDQVKRISRIPVFLFVIFYFLAILFITVFFEEGASATRVVTFKGIFNQPAVDWPLTQIYIGHLYGKLYSILPGLPWYGFIDYFLVFSALIFYFILVKRNAPWFISLVFCLLAIDDIVMFSFTRSAMLIIGAAFLFLFFLTEKYRNKEVSFPYFLAYFLFLNGLIILGFFNRPQVFIYLLALFFLFLFFYQIITKRVFKNLQTLAWLAVPVAVVSVSGAYYYVTASDDLKASQRLAPRFYNIFLGKFHDDISQLSEGDSLALMMMKGNFVNDRNVYNEDFTDRITQNSPREYFSLRKFFDPQLVGKAWLSYSPYYFTNHFYDLLIVLFFSVFLVYRFIKERNTKAFLIFLYMAGCLFSLVIVTFVVKMEMRVSSPVFLFIFVTCIILAKQAGFSFDLPKSIKMAVALAIFILICTAGYRLKKKALAYYDYTVNNERIIAALDANFSNHTVIVSNPSIRIFARTPFCEFNYTGTNTFKTYEGEAIIYMPSMQKMIRDYCGSLEMKDFFDTMVLQKETTVYITNPEWLRLMQAYMLHFYHKKYIFYEVPDKTGTLDATGTSLKFYRPAGIEEPVHQ